MRALFRLFFRVPGYRAAQQLAHVGLGLPAEAAFHLLDRGLAVLHVVVALAVVDGGRDDVQLRGLGGLAELRKFLRLFDEHLRRLFYRIVVVGVADVEDFVVAAVVLVADDRHEPLYAVADPREAAALLSAVDERYAAAVYHVVEHLRHGARAAFLGVALRVEPRPYPVEGAEYRELQPGLVAVGEYHAVHHLLRAAVYPAHFDDGAGRERAFVLLELLARAHAVDLGGGGEDYALVVLHAEAHHFEVLFEVELEGPYGLFDVVGRLRYPRERDDRVGFYDLRLERLVVLENVAAPERELRVPLVGREIRRSDVEPAHLPVGRREHRVEQMRADKSVYPSYEQSHSEPLLPNANSSSYIRRILS